MVVEVISPNDIYIEVEEKVFAWLAAGTRMVIVVNPRRRTVTRYDGPNRVEVLTEEETLDGDEVVRGWVVTVRDIFG